MAGFSSSSSMDNHISLEPAYIACQMAMTKAFVVIDCFRGCLMASNTGKYMVVRCLFT